MIDEQRQDLVLQYLLGELDSSQMETIRAQLESDPELKTFALQMEETVGSLGYAVKAMAAPADLPARILRAERGSAIPVPQESRVVRFNFIPWALAACLAIACTILGLDRERIRAGFSKELAALRETNIATEKSLAELKDKSADSESKIESARAKSAELEKQLAELQQKNAEAQTELAKLEQRSTEAEQALTALRQKDTESQKELTALRQKDLLSQIKIATLKAQVAGYRQTNAVVIWDADQRSGVLQLDKLPPPTAGKDYQLWVIDPKNPQPVSAGLLSVPNNGLIRASFHPTGPIESAAAFAISIEKKGGSMKPEGQIILVGK
jgi:anti-sigma-K factor RskA